MPLAKLTGIFDEKIPNTSHIKVPNENKKYIGSDIPEVSLVCIVSMACGIKEAVVQVAAIRPITVIKFIKTIF
ncbi:MAG: hypothetical protein ABI863_16810 [Ginsengibacter sp.]